MHNLILIGGRALIMSKTIHEFNDIIRKLRKDLFGKGPERIHTVLLKIWLSQHCMEI